MAGEELHSALSAGHCVRVNVSAALELQLHVGGEEGCCLIWNSHLVPDCLLPSCLLQAMQDVKQLASKLFTQGSPLGEHCAGRAAGVLPVLFSSMATCSFAGSTNATRSAFLFGLTKQVLCTQRRQRDLQPGGAALGARCRGSRQRAHRTQRRPHAHAHGAGVPMLGLVKLGAGKLSLPVAQSACSRPAGPYGVGARSVVG